MTEYVSEARLEALERLQRDAGGIQMFADEAHRSLVTDGWERATAALLIIAANVGLDSISSLRACRAERAELLEALRAVQHNRTCSCYGTPPTPCARCEAGYDEVDAALEKLERRPE